MRTPVHNADNFNQLVSVLPRATEYEVFAKEKNSEHYIDGKQYKAVIVDGDIVHIPSKRYGIIQHEDCFRPVIEGLTLAGVQDWKFQLKNDKRRADLHVFTASVKDNKSEILFGFKVTNSFDGSTSVDYGLKLNQGKAWIELVGYRQICSNGMMVRVPLEEAKIIQPELRGKITELLGKTYTFRHTTKVAEKVQGVQYVVEAMALLRDPLQAIIDKAGQIGILDLEKAEQLIEKHFSKRMQKRILNRFVEDQDQEGSGFWALYNAMTAEATHGDYSVSRQNSIIEKASLVLAEATIGGQ